MRPEELLQLNRYVWMSRVLISCIDIDLFSAVGEDGAAENEVVLKTGASQTGIRRLLNVLIPMGLLDRDDGGKYMLTEFSRNNLLPGSPGYMGPQIGHLDRLWQSWGDLTATIKTGEPYWKRHQGRGDLSHLVQLAEGLFPRNFSIAKKAAEALGAGKSWKGIEILDVGAGSGAWSLAFLVSDPEAKTTAVDFGPVLEMAKGKAGKLGVAERFSVLEGNLREVDFGEGRFDLVILGHICHSEGAEHSKALINKSARALRSAGRLLIAEMVPDDDRRGPLFPLLFSLNMLVNTLEGDTFTFSEYAQWCRDAGLVNTRLLPLPVENHSPLIISEKP